jgi:hypothetical protein
MPILRSLRIRDTVGPGNSVDTRDIPKLKMALNHLGYYDAPSYGMNKYPDLRMFEAIEAFQGDHGLIRDGIIRPNGPTLDRLNKDLEIENVAFEQLSGPVDQMTGAGIDFWTNYRNMRRANWKGADKYFHCLANCQASRRGVFGEGTAAGISEAREWWDQNIKGYPPSDSEADQKANRRGRVGARQFPNLSCQEICAQYRPVGLPDQY